MWPTAQEGDQVGPQCLRAEGLNYQLKSLMALSLSLNYLSGTIPASIYNLSSIYFISLVGNQVEGSIPPDLGHAFPNLKEFLLTGNQFGGPIPITISNASKLENFEISVNNFTGKVPSLASLPNLLTLGIHHNNLGYGDDDDLNFLTSLANCTNLKHLQISDNNFRGTLKSMNNLSTKLELISFGANWIYGSIPSIAGNFINLGLLALELNQLTGPIPSSIGKLQKLRLLYLNNNELSGIIPSSLGNLTLLSGLYLASNALKGSIPSSLGLCKNLLAMALSQNNLTGPIPKEVMGLSSLSLGLYLSDNQLAGPIPTQVGNLVSLGHLDVSKNKLTGEIPETLGGCTSLIYLHMNGNSLRGTIPSSLSSLRGIEEIDLSSNNLSGMIPAYLKAFHFLQNLNLSFNDFEGEVPVQGVFGNASALSVAGNARLCGGIPQLNLSRCTSNTLYHKKHKLSRKLKLIFSISGEFVSLVLLAIISLMALYLLRKRGKSPNLGSPFGISLLKVSYGDLLKATDGFSSANLIGVGSFGSVYKGIFSSSSQAEERIFAVKVLNLRTSRESKSFVAECKALKNLKHRNLVRLVTSCSSIDFQGNDFKALVYEYMANKSLQEWLHHPDDEHNKHLDFIERLNIAIDVANGLDYLQNHCHVPIAHCDLKPSNVLLDNDMTARIGDFGLARFLSNASHSFFSGQQSSIGIRGSIGYAAPEYGMGSEVSTFGDIYSYGILLLEMFTGKRPTDSMFQDGLNLHNFVQMALPERVEEILDPILLLERQDDRESTHSWNEAKYQKIKQCLISILHIGIACSAELPRERLEITNVVAELNHTRDILVRTRIPRAS